MQQTFGYGWAAGFFRTFDTTWRAAVLDARRRTAARWAAPGVGGPADRSRRSAYGQYKYMETD